MNKALQAIQVHVDQRDRGGQFRHVRIVCQDALDHLVPADLVGESFNAADLSCVEVRRVYRDDGDEWWQLLVEEASPECPRLQAFVRNWMEKAGIEGVEVLTQW